MSVCLLEGGRWKGEGRGGGDLGKTEKGGLTQGRSLSCVKLQSLRKEAKKNASKSQKRCCFDTTRNCGFRITRREI